MTLKEYINTHPEQFKDDIDKWLFLKFGIIGGCCSAEKSHEYHIARMVAEKLTDALIEKACNWFRRIDYDDSMPPFETTEEFIKGFKKAMKEE